MCWTSASTHLCTQQTCYLNTWCYVYEVNVIWENITHQYKVFNIIWLNYYCTTAQYRRTYNKGFLPVCVYAWFSMIQSQLKTARVIICRDLGALNVTAPLCVSSLWLRDAAAVGEAAAGKASRSLAQHIPGQAGVEGMKVAASGVVGELARARIALDERGQRLGELEERTALMMSSAENFSKHAHEVWVLPALYLPSNFGSGWGLQMQDWQKQPGDAFLPSEGNWNQWILLFNNVCFCCFFIAADAKVQRQEMVPVLTAEQRKEAALFALLETWCRDFHSANESDERGRLASDFVLTASRLGCSYGTVTLLEDQNWGLRIQMSWWHKVEGEREGRKEGGRENGGI